MYALLWMNDDYALCMNPWYISSSTSRLRFRSVCSASSVSSGSSPSGSRDTQDRIVPSPCAENISSPSPAAPFPRHARALIRAALNAVERPWNCPRPAMSPGTRSRLMNVPSRSSNMKISPRSSFSLKFGHRRVSCPGPVSPCGMRRGTRSARCEDALLRTRGPKCTRVFAPVDASQTRIRASCPVVTRCEPVDVQRTPVTAPLCARACRENAGRGCCVVVPGVGAAPTPSSMSSVAMAELCPALRMSKIITRLSADAEARICGWCGAHETDSTEPVCPGNPCVDRPVRRSNNRTDFSLVPTAMSNDEPECDDRECEYGVWCRLNVCAGVIVSGVIADIFNVPSCDVVKMVDGTGSKG